MISILHVEGNRIKNASGNSVILRGVDDSITTWWDAGVGYDAAQFTYMKNWGCNAVRINIGMWDIGYTPGNLGVYENSTFLARLDSLVDAAIANGIYPIICGWHAILDDCPDGSNSINVAHFMSTYHTWNDYIAVYTLLAQRYAGKGVLYEMYNEPLYCSLSTYKTQMEATIDAIRTYDANAIAIVQAVGTGDWETQSLQFVQSYAINRTNVVYCVHEYAWQVTDNSQATIRWKLGSNGNYSAYADWCLSNGYPVICTEFGGGGNGVDYSPHTWSESGVAAFSTTWLNNFMTVMDADGYCGYTAWRWCTAAYDDPWNLLADWNGNSTEYGTVIKNCYLTNEPPTTFSLTINSATGGTTDPAAGVTEHDAGEEITVTAYPDEENDYYFQAWLINGTAVSNSPYSFNIYSDTAVTPLFNTSSPESNDIAPKLTIALGSVGVPQGDVVSAKVHLGGTKEVSSFELKLQNWSAKYSPSGSYPLSVGQDGYIRIGRGSNVPQIITTRTEEAKFESTPLENYVVVSGRCWGEKLFRQVVTKTYSNQKGEDIVKDLLDYYSGLSHVRNSVELVENTSTTYTLLEYENTPVWDILRAIAESSDNSGVIGYDFRVAPDAKFEFFPRGSKTSPVSLNEKIEESLYSKNIFGVRNRVTIYGAATKSYPLNKDGFTEALSDSVHPSPWVWTCEVGAGIATDTSVKFIGSKSTRLDVVSLNYGMATIAFGESGVYQYVNANLYPELHFQVRHEHIFDGRYSLLLVDINDNAMLLNGNINALDQFVEVVQKVGEKNASSWSQFSGSSFDWTQIKKVKITFYCSTDSSTHSFYIDQFYFGGRRYSNMQEDSSSQSSYGLRMLVDTDEELYSDNECMLRAKAVLANKKDPAEYLTVKSTVIDYGATPLLPGDKISVVLPNENVNADFRIISVEYEVDGKTQTLMVSLELGREVPLLADYMYRLRSKVDHVSRHKIAR